MATTHKLRATAAIAACIACAAPVLFLLMLSVSDRWAFPRILPDAFRFSAWMSILSGGEEGLGGSLLLSLLISATVALVATSGGFIASKYIAYHRRRRGLLLVAYLPFAMSPVILGACIHYLYIEIGLAGSLAGVVLAQSIFAMGFGVIFFSSFWNRERRALEEMAMLLGGTGTQIYRRVLIPAARGMLLICALQTFLFSWFQYGLTMLIGAGRVKTLPVLVFMYVGEANISYAALSSAMLVLPPVLMLWANRRFLYRYM